MTSQKVRKFQKSSEKIETLITASDFVKLANFNFFLVSFMFNFSCYNNVFYYESHFEDEFLSK